MRLDYMNACNKFFATKRYSRDTDDYAKISKIVARARRAAQARLEGVPLERIPLETWSGPTIKNWYLRWTKAGEGLTSLIPLDDLKGRRGFRLDPEVEQIIADRIREDYLVLEGPPLTHAILLIEGDIRAANEGRAVKLHLPDAMTIRRWVKSNVAPFDLVYYREGPAAAEQKFRHVRKALQAGRPLEIVEIDHTPLDVLVVYEDGSPVRNKRSKKKRIKRVWLTVAICAATRMIYGFYISTDRPSWTSIMNCIRMGALPKNLDGINVASKWPVFGIMEVLVLDNAKEHHSRSMKGAAGQLRFELRYMPRRKPHLKGKVERFIGTIARDFCAYLVGRTFRDTREKGDYKSSAKAGDTVGQIVEKFTIWVVDIYHNRRHGGLLGQSPLSRWRDLEGFGVRLPPNADDLKPLLSLVIDRTIQRDGITFLGLKYQSDALKNARRGKDFHWGKEYLIKVDPYDLGTILVLIDDERGWEAIPCEDLQLVAGRSLAEWRDAIALAREMTARSERVARETMYRAMRLLREDARRAGSVPVRMTQNDIDWYREHADDPYFAVSPTPGDEKALVDERRRQRRTRVSAAPASNRKPKHAASACRMPIARPPEKLPSQTSSSSNDDFGPEEWTVE
ncbi:MAG: Mu transposase C-terminal domain-containing protein [Methylobacterium sp.]|nr:Mu transposase C-terminal domain-containing protein [Methylobacterium sp.]MBY0296767.1 Mu transposase C-terminal domain-containing protein [Methylobacterium sp.]